MVAETDGDGDGEGAQSGPGQIVAFAKWRMVREQLPEDKYARSDEMTVEELGEGTNVEVYNAFIGGLHRLMAKWWKGEPCLCKSCRPVCILTPSPTARHPKEEAGVVHHVTHARIRFNEPTHSPSPLLPLLLPPKTDLHILAADPARQRLGAGSALLAWGAALADREGRPSWLEASPQGYPLYRRFGYEDVDVQDVAVTERWGPTRAGGEDWGQGSAVALAGALREGCFRSVVMRRSPPRGLEGSSSG